MDPRKASAEWLHSNVFRGEPIRPQARRAPGTIAEPVPAAIQAARALENGGFRSWQSRESVFLKQGKLLEYYTDDCEDCGDVVCYYPTYQSLTNPQLRSYFSWRTRVRLGEVRRTALSFAFLYIYELINQIGVKDPLDGYRKLLAFRDEYDQLDQAILPYLSHWLVDYVVYYGLDPALLADSPKVLFDRSVMVLERIGEAEDAAVAGAVRQLSRWLKHSKFYAQHREDMDEVVVRVLREVSAHYAKGRSKTMTERYFGVLACQGAEPFCTAVFCNPLKRRNYEYAVDEQRVYRCRDGIWSVYSRCAPSTPGGLDRLLKTIDCVMRREFGCSPVKPGVETKWIVRLIETEVQALLARQRAAEAKKITLDPARLSRIRLDAAVTQEKLIVDEEDEVLPETASVPPTPAEAQAGGDAVPLDPVQVRLLRCLLRGEDTAWVQYSGPHVKTTPRKKCVNQDLEILILSRPEPPLTDMRRASRREAGSLDRAAMACYTGRPRGCAHNLVLTSPHPRRPWLNRPAAFCQGRRKAARSSPDKRPPASCNPGLHGAAGCCSR